MAKPHLVDVEIHTLRELFVVRAGGDQKIVAGRETVGQFYRQRKRHRPDHRDRIAHLLAAGLVDEQHLEPVGQVRVIRVDGPPGNADEADARYGAYCHTGKASSTPGPGQPAIAADPYALP